jgi:predicted RNA-binding Zn ribbon-like protein
MTNTMKRSDLVGGNLALDFVNTVSWRGREAPEERIDSYADLVTWSEMAGAVSRPSAVRLLRTSNRRPRRAADVLGGARRLRECLHRLFSSRSRSRPLDPGDLWQLNATLRRAPGRKALVAVGQSLVWRPGVGSGLEEMLWPIAWSAADLLVGTTPERLKVCAGAGCGWLFLDDSRNRSRRWCSMSDCGNRAKARRHYAKARGRSTRRSP